MAKVGNYTELEGGSSTKCFCLNCVIALCLFSLMVAIFAVLLLLAVDSADCGAPPSAPAHGHFVSMTGTTLNSTATYSCDEGYKMRGNDTVTCFSGRVWGVPPSCIAFGCGPVPHQPLHGQAVSNTGTSYNSTATYACDTGYYMVGANTIVCYVGGTWSPVPTCNITDCGSVPVAPSNGQLVSHTGTTYQSTATYSCDAGYDVTGSTTITCQADGSWETPPTCTIKDCGTVPSAPANGEVVSVTGTTYLSTVTYSCNTGYDVTGSATITCQVDGAWQSPPTCTVTDCGSVPVAPSNGQLVSHTGTTYQSTATYSCDAGYDVTGNTTITCQADGSWETPPTCTIKDCGTVPSAPANGEVVSVTGTTYLSTVTYSCNTGYDVTGSATITCQVNGTWQSPPTCTITDCGSVPVAPSNGQLVSHTGTTYQSTATYSCDAGYDVTGSTTITCQADGSWETPPTCTLKDCHEPTPPSNGVVQYGDTTYGAIAVFSCKPGFTFSGHSTVTCGSDGQWGNCHCSCSTTSGSSSTHGSGNVGAFIFAILLSLMWYCN